MSGGLPLGEATAYTWAEAYGVKINDPDGWRSEIKVYLPGGSLMTFGPAELHWKIREREFWLRVAYSTVEFTNAAAKQQMLKFWPLRDLSVPTPTLDLAQLFDETRGGHGA